MSNDNASLLTIFTEAALESRLIQDIEKLGASGYTVTNARGKGSRGIRAGSWEANSNIRVEVICDDHTAHALSEHLKKTYYQHYAMVTFISDIEVLRPNKFSS